MGSLAGKIVVVTGAAGGQGAAQARALAAAGARVVAADLPDAADLPAAADLPGASPGIEYRRLDVTDEAQWTELAAGLGGRVDALVNNAGITWRARLADVRPEDLARVYAVNVTGPVLGMRALAPLMPPGGSIVNVGSAAALTGHFAIAYTASKWALRGVSKTACVELGPRGIRVNMIHPGFIETPMTANAAPAFRGANLAQTPLGRAGTVADVAPLVVFLVGDSSAYISGAEIPVDGGLTAHGGSKPITDALFGA